MKKKLIAIALVSMLGLTACGNSESSKNEKSEKTAAETTTQAETEEETTEADAEAETTTEAESEAETTTEESAELPEYSEFKLVDGLSENYADLDNRAFAYEGKVYKLGEVTLQELIDAGLPFKESHLNNKDNNINKNHETSAYDVELNDYSTVQLTFINQTDSNLTEKECLLSEVRWYIIYTPHDDYQESLNKEIIEKLNDCSEKIGFSFPLTLKKDELLEKCPEPTDSNDYGNVEYKVKSEVYMGSSGYSFSFDNDNDQLKSVTITWLP